MLTEIIAHRGSKCNRPENTLASFKEACRVGADGIELDVHLSKDGKLVVIHDESLDRTTNAKGLVRDYTLNELKAFDAGSWFSKDFAGEKIPLLSEVLDALIKWHFTGSLNIEVKTDKFHYPEIEKRLLELIESQDLPFHIIYSSFNFKSLKILHELNPELDLAALAKHESAKIQKAENISYIQALHIHYSYFLRPFKVFKKPCRLWTVNQPFFIKWAFRKKAAAVITDFPQKALELRNK